MQTSGSGSSGTSVLGELSGKVMGGNTPIIGTTVTLYSTAVNSSITNGSYVGTANVLGTATTGPGGIFAFTTAPACANNSLVYVTMSGGNSGGKAINSNILLGSVYGLCQNVTTTSFIVVNEASTLAMAYAFSSFTSVSGTTVNITAPANNSSFATTNSVASGTVSTASGLSHAYANFKNLVDPVAGAALAIPFSDAASQVNDSTLAHAIAPQAVVNTLANVLQACVNSGGVNPYLVFPAATGSPLSSSVTVLNTADTVGGPLQIVADGVETDLTVPSGTLAAAAAYITTNDTAVVATPGATSLTITSVDVSGGATLTFKGTATNTLNLTDTPATATEAGDNCGQVFADTPALGGTVPSNTFQAALNLARNPWVSNSNVTALFGLMGSIGNSAYSPVLGTAPNDWTLAIQYPLPRNPLSGTAAFPFTLALDADDNVFVTSPEDDPWAINLSGTTNYTADSISACVYGWSANGTFLPSITDYSGTGGTVGVAGSGSAGTSGGWFCTSSADSTTQQDYLLTSIAADNAGNVWVANYGLPGATGLNHIIKLANAGSFVAEEVAPLLGGQTTYNRVNNLIVDKLNNVIYSLQASSGGPTVAAVSGSSSGTTLNSLTLNTTNGIPQPPSAVRGLAVDPTGDIFGAGFGAQGNPASGLINLGGNVTAIPIEAAQSTSTGNYTCTTGCTSGRIATGVAAGTTGNTATNNGPYGVAVDSSNNVWVTAGGIPGETSSVGHLGVYKCTETFSGTTGFITSQSCAGSGTATATAATAPKFLEADGNNVLWIADTTGILAYATAASPAIATISETGGFKPCIPVSGSCTYPDFNTSIRGIAVDSTGSVWFTTPDLTHSTTNANSLVQIIGTASATWPLLAVQKPGTMPQ